MTRNQSVSKEKISENKLAIMVSDNGMLINGSRCAKTDSAAKRRITRIWKKAYNQYRRRSLRGTMAAMVCEWEGYGVQRLEDS
jgi:hypothetical protein